MATELCILTCRSFEREVAAVIEAQQIKDVTVKSFAGACLRPAADRATLTQAVRECTQAGMRVAIFGGRCLAGLQELLEDDRVTVYTAENCPELALNRQVIHAYTAAGAYVTTPGGLAEWAETLAQADLAPTPARAALGAAAQRILLLDTGVYPDSLDQLQAFATFVGLPGEVLPVGLTTVELHLEKILAQFRLHSQQNQAIADSAHANRQSADYAMLFDLISALGGITTEGEVVEKIFEVFTLFCVPSRLVYVPLIEGTPGDGRARPAYIGVSDAVKTRMTGLRSGYAWTESGKGFTLRIGRRNQIFAMLEVDGFAYPDLKRDYLNLALNIAPVLALAIANARQFQKLNEAKALLERSNAELEQFAAVVSNDLREPLRTIAHYLEQLQARHATQLPADAVTLIAQANAGTGYMQKLVDDLLAYCRVDMVDRAFELIDCDVVVQQVLRNLAGLIEAAGATLTCDPLPAVSGDAAQLTLVFQNLIGNAIKFRSARPPEITIRAELQIGEPAAGEAEISWLFAVQDNGIGIDPEHTDQIFGLFRHAPDQEARNGTGMGLALCKKIIERHGGRIWFESQPGQGTTFYFTMPAG